MYSTVYCRREPGDLGARTSPSDMRRIINGILYLNKTGCQWRMIPPTFGHWSTIYGYFKRWRRDGVWGTPHGNPAPVGAPRSGAPARAIRREYR